MEQYCSVHVDQMGTDAEGALVYLGALLVALSLSGCIVLVDRAEAVPLRVFPVEHRSTAKDGELATVHLILRPGHYDLLYPGTDMTVQQLTRQFNSDGRGQDCPDSPAVKVHVVEPVAQVTELAPFPTRIIVRCLVSWLRPTGLRVLPALNGGGQPLGDEKAVPSLASASVSLAQLLLALLHRNGAEECKGEGRRPREWEGRDTALYVNVTTAEEVESEVREFFGFKADRACTWMAGDVLSIPSTEGAIEKVPGKDGWLAPVALLDCANNQTVTCAVSGVVVVRLILEEDIVSHLVSLARTSSGERWDAVEQTCLLAVDTFRFPTMAALLGAVRSLVQYPADKSLDFDGMAQVRVGDLKDGTVLHLTSKRDVAVVFQGNTTTLRLSADITKETLEIKIREALGLTERTSVEMIFCTPDGERISRGRYLIQYWAMVVAVEVSRCEAQDCSAGLYALNRLSSCGHSFCLSCLESKISAASSARRPPTPYCIPEGADVSTLEHFSLIPIPCPRAQCPDTLAVEDLISMPSSCRWHHLANEELERLKSYRTCGLEEIYRCYSSPLSEMFKMSCDHPHFFHKDCLADYLKAQYEEARAQIKPLACPSCKFNNLTCACPMCQHDNGPHQNSGPHIIQGGELKCIGQDLLTDSYIMKMENLVTFSCLRENGQRIFDCKCGMLYSVNNRMDTSNCECGYAACLKVTDYHFDNQSLSILPNVIITKLSPWPVSLRGARGYEL